MFKKNLKLWAIMLCVVIPAWALTTKTGLSIINSVINSTPIGQSVPAAGGFTGLNTQTFQLNGAAPSGHTLVGNGTYYVDTAPTAVARTCSGSSCYKIDGDGTIEQWGVTSVCGSSGGPGCSYTFPINFTSSTFLSVVGTVTCSREPNLSTVVTSFSTTGFTMATNGSVNVGGSGGGYGGGCTYSWQAKGY